MDLIDQIAAIIRQGAVISAPREGGRLIYHVGMALGSVGRKRWAVWVQASPTLASSTTHAYPALAAARWLGYVGEDNARAAIMAHQATHIQTAFM
jgi:hypothetical protein